MTLAIDKMTINRINARDRRKAAIHEAGHMVVASALGYYPRGWIFENEHVSDPLDQKMWGGRTTIRGLVDLDDRKLIGVAGFVAETIWDCVEDVDLGDMLAWDQNMMSSSDWQMCGAEPGECKEDIEESAKKAHALLAGQHRKHLFRIAR
ncbi:hypothetical protein DK058_26140, partial [Salmonella enterica subsp. enterica serovar Typhi]|nr:hypothetical protein [Salmonella enterica subsp. enterica serovar Typhi]